MSVPGPVLGPCVSWIDGSDVAACCGIADCDPPTLLDTVALEASMALYEISGRQFTGQCTKTVRPCADGCGCWGVPSLGLGPYYWATSAYGVAPGGYPWMWRNECGDVCRGCGTLSKVKLSGYPVTEIVEVKIDGAVLGAFDSNGNPNYKLAENRRDLIRLDDPGPPQQPRRWPACQNMALDSSQPGTFEVTYRHGVNPPPLGMDAAAELACQLYVACSGGENCVLPAGVTRVVRQNVEVDRQLLANWFDPTKATGLVRLDLFLASYWRVRRGRRPAVYSPDVQQYARRLGY